MAPKKKGKGNKLARMSEEERVRYMQHRAAIEEEARRRKQQLIALFCKNKLKHEEAFTRLNVAKINQQWRQILRQIKTQELRQEVAELQKSFDHVVTTKNLVLADMAQDLADADDQYSMMLQSHSETVDKLIALHGARLTELRDNFVSERAQLVTARHTDRAHIEGSLQNGAQLLRVVMHAGTVSHAQAQQDANAKRQRLFDQARDEILSTVETLTSDSEAQLEALWTSLGRVVARYLTGTETLRRQHARLAARDEASATQLRQADAIAAHLTKQLAAQTQLADQSQGGQGQLGAARAEREALKRVFQGLRVKFGQETQMDKERLTRLTLISADTIKTLQGQVEKGERILQLASACSRLETQREKVAPFGDVRVASAASAASKTDPNEGADSPDLRKEEGDEVFCFAALDGFWQRHNAVLLQLAALGGVQLAARRENRALRGAIQRYLTVVAHGGSEAQLSQALVKLTI